MTRLHLLDNPLHQLKEAPYALSLAVAEQPEEKEGPSLAGWWVLCSYRDVFLK